jgi:hypothetical protein
MMKTLISSFLHFYLFMSRGRRSFDCRKFFSKILKCDRDIAKNVITTNIFAAKLVIVIDNVWIDVIINTGCVSIL